jgi:hypothetical protein
METKGRSPVRASAKPSRGPWRLRWYEAVATMGSGNSGASADLLADAIALAPWPEAQRVEVEPDDDGSVRVIMIVKGRHAGDACSKAADLLASAAPPQWDWASATVRAMPVQDGIRRWPRLGVMPLLGEERCASAALWVAGYAAGTDKPQETVLELLGMLGLTVSAGAREAQ